MTTSTPERELFRFRTSLMVCAPLDLTGFYDFTIGLGLMPWRGVAFGIALLFLGIAVLPHLTTSEVVLFPSLLALLVGPIALEALYRRDVLTETAVVRQRGFLGKTRTVIPLAEIQRVEYSFPRWGRYWDVGDVVVQTAGGGAVLRGIKRPASAAQVILDAKARALRALQVAADA